MWECTDASVGSALGVVGGPATYGCEIEILCVSQKTGPFEQFLGPTASTLPRIVSGEVAMMACGLGLGRTRQRHAATAESVTIVDSHIIETSFLGSGLCALLRGVDALTHKSSVSARTQG